jgi:hypothetical protein
VQALQELKQLFQMDIQCFCRDHLKAFLILAQALPARLWPCCSGWSRYHWRELVLIEAERIAEFVWRADAHRRLAS